MCVLIVSSEETFEDETGTAYKALHTMPKKVLRNLG